MNYGLLIGFCPLAGIAGLLVDMFICGFIQILYELRGEIAPNVDRLFAILIFPCWIIIWFASYYVYNNY